MSTDEQRIQEIVSRLVREAKGALRGATVGQPRQLAYDLMAVNVSIHRTDVSLSDFSAALAEVQTRLEDEHPDLNLQLMPRIKPPMVFEVSDRRGHVPYIVVAEDGEEYQIFSNLGQTPPVGVVFEGHWFRTAAERDRLVDELREKYPEARLIVDPKWSGEFEPLAA